MLEEFTMSKQIKQIIFVCALFISRILSGDIEQLEKLANVKDTIVIPVEVEAPNNLEHKIVYLIAPPRSLSTAFLRMMQNRGDFEVIHEPSLSQYGNLAITQFNDMLLKKIQLTNVFIKEISCWGSNKLLKNKSLIKQKNVYFLFLMRNPHHAIISRYKRKNKSTEMKIFSDRTGYKDLYTIFMYVKKEATNSPQIILSEDLYNNPGGVCELVCNFLTIPYRKNALQWDPLGDNFSGDAWNSIKPLSTMHDWNSAVMNSTGFHIPTQYKIDAQGLPTFEEVSDSYKEMCKKAYVDNTPYYNLLLAEEAFLLRPIIKD